MGNTAKMKNGIGILRFDSTAESIDGTRRSNSHACACRIKAKKATAIVRPIICMMAIPYHLVS